MTDWRLDFGLPFDKSFCFMLYRIYYDRAVNNLALNSLAIIIIIILYSALFTSLISSVFQNYPD